jgi:hypothetical protein
MRLRIPVPALCVLALALVGCGGGEKKSPPRTTLDTIEVKGENLTKADRLYTEGNQLYFRGGVGVPEKQRQKNLELAIKKYRAARGIYAKALRRHPDHLRLQNRVREIDGSIEGCRRMINMNIMK